jgi:carboxyl-terminal processing protease
MRRTFFVLPAIIVGCSLVGGIYGPGLTSAAAASSEDETRNAVDSFTRVYALLERNFADPVTGDKAVYRGAIPGMLRTLDPHSNFFDPRDFQLLREDQRGHYFGVGMSIGASRTGNPSKTIVYAPFPGSPAYKAGIRPGDTILAVDDKPTDKLTLTEIADMLKGPRGTRVKVTIGRDGSDTPLTFQLIRDEIPKKTVQDAFWIKPGIAFLEVDSFNENTSHEVEKNLRDLGESGIKGLVLDLRANPGGLLNEGVAVAGRFLQKGQAIVSHRGRASTEKPYVSKNGNGGHDYPIVVLVNSYSASAAEIVAGALQDHDRAWILGENTFGKGLVQTVYPLSENTGLALTTARYYTPSGRLIQRDYSHISFYDYYFHKDTDTKNLLDAKSTDSGRTVYGGAGITPDEKFVEPKLDAFEVLVKLRKYAFFNFVSHYLGTHDAKLPAGWAPDNIIVEDFHRYLLDQKVEFTEAEFTQHQDWVKQELKREMYQSTFGIEDARRLTVETDPEVAKAIEAMPKASALLQQAKRVIAQRVSHAQ